MNTGLTSTKSGSFRDLARIKESSRENITLDDEEKQSPKSQPSLRSKNVGIFSPPFFHGRSGHRKLQHGRVLTTLPCSRSPQLPPERVLYRDVITGKWFSFCPTDPNLPHGHTIPSSDQINYSLAKKFPLHDPRRKNITRFRADLISTLARLRRPCDYLTPGDIKNQDYKHSFFNRTNLLYRSDETNKVIHQSRPYDYRKINFRHFLSNARGEVLQNGLRRLIIGSKFKWDIPSAAVFQLPQFRAYHPDLSFIDRPRIAMMISNRQFTPLIREYIAELSHQTQLVSSNMRNRLRAVSIQRSGVNSLSNQLQSHLQQQEDIILQGGDASILEQQEKQLTPQFVIQLLKTVIETKNPFDPRLEAITDRHFDDNMINPSDEEYELGTPRSHVNPQSSQFLTDILSSRSCLRPVFFMNRRRPSASSLQQKDFKPQKFSVPLLNHSLSSQLMRLFPTHFKIRRYILERAPADPRFQPFFPQLLQYGMKSLRHCPENWSHIESQELSSLQTAQAQFKLCSARFPYLNTPADELNKMSKKFSLPKDHYLHQSNLKKNKHTALCDGNQPQSRALYDIDHIPKGKNSHPTHPFLTPKILTNFITFQFPKLSSSRQCQREIADIDTISGWVDYHNPIVQKYENLRLPFQESFSLYFDPIENDDVDDGHDDGHDDGARSDNLSTTGNNYHYSPTRNETLLLPSQQITSMMTEMNQHRDGLIAQLQHELLVHHNVRLTQDDIIAIQNRTYPVVPVNEYYNKLDKLDKSTPYVTHKMIESRFINLLPNGFNLIKTRQNMKNTGNVFKWLFKPTKDLSAQDFIMNGVSNIYDTLDTKHVLHLNHLKGSDNANTIPLYRFVAHDAEKCSSSPQIHPTSSQTPTEDAPILHTCQVFHPDGQFNGINSSPWFECQSPMKPNYRAIKKNNAGVKPKNTTPMQKKGDQINSSKQTSISNPNSTSQQDSGDISSEIPTPTIGGLTDHLIDPNTAAVNAATNQEVIIGPFDNFVVVPNQTKDKAAADDEFMGHSMPTGEDHQETLNDIMGHSMPPGDTPHPSEHEPVSRTSDLADSFFKDQRHENKVKGHSHDDTDHSFEHIDFDKEYASDQSDSNDNFDKNVLNQSHHSDGKQPQPQQGVSKQFPPKDDIFNKDHINDAPSQNIDDGQKPAEIGTAAIGAISAGVDSAKNQNNDKLNQLPADAKQQIQQKQIERQQIRQLQTQQQAQQQRPLEPIKNDANQNRIHPLPGAAVQKQQQLQQRKGDLDKPTQFHQPASTSLAEDKIQSQPLESLQRQLQQEHSIEKSPLNDSSRQDSSQGKNIQSKAAEIGDVVGRTDSIPAIPAAIPQSVVNKDQNDKFDPNTPNKKSEISQNPQQSMPTHQNLPHSAQNQPSYQDIPPQDSTQSRTPPTVPPNSFEQPSNMTTQELTEALFDPTNRRLSASSSPVSNPRRRSSLSGFSNPFDESNPVPQATSPFAGQTSNISVQQNLQPMNSAPSSIFHTKPINSKYDISGGGSRGSIPTDQNEFKQSEPSTPPYHSQWVPNDPLFAEQLRESHRKSISPKQSQNSFQSFITPTHHQTTKPQPREQQLAQPSNELFQPRWVPNDPSYADKLAESHHKSVSPKQSQNLFQSFITPTKNIAPTSANIASTANYQPSSSSSSSSSTTTNIPVSSQIGIVDTPQQQHPSQIDSDSGLTPSTSPNPGNSFGGFFTPTHNLSFQTHNVDNPSSTTIPELNHNENYTQFGVSRIDDEKTEKSQRTHNVHNPKILKPKSVPTPLSSFARRTATNRQPGRRL
jgi:hypothetical protein